MGYRCRGEQLQRRIVLHFPVLNDAAVAVIGVLTQTHVGHDQQVEFGAANRFDGALNGPAGGVGLAAASILLIRNAEQDNSRNTELLDFAALLEKLVHRLLRDARHRTDWIPHVLPGADKHRINETMRRKARLARQGSDSFAAPETARPRHGEIHRDLAWGT